MRAMRRDPSEFSGEFAIPKPDVPNRKKGFRPPSSFYETLARPEDQIHPSAPRSGKAITFSYDEIRRLPAGGVMYMTLFDTLADGLLGAVSSGKIVVSTHNCTYILALINVPRGTSVEILVRCRYET
jgi:hypothetical protein